MTLHQNMTNLSDGTDIFVCKSCGLIVYNDAKGITKCRRCSTNSEASRTFIPYAYKLLHQELLGFGIATRHITDPNTLRIPSFTHEGQG